MTKTARGFRLSEEAWELLAALAEDKGLSKAGVLELVVRQTAIHDLSEPKLVEIRHRIKLNEQNKNN